jgi:hypothetical protein
MPFIDPREDFHHYAGAEAFVGDIPLGDGTTKRYLKFRIHTVLMKPDGETPDSSQWVFIPVEDLEQFSAQMAATAVSAKRWAEGQPFQSVGENIGVHNTTGKYD